MVNQVNSNIPTTNEPSKNALKKNDNSSPNTPYSVSPVTGEHRTSYQISLARQEIGQLNEDVQNLTHMFRGLMDQIKNNEQKRDRSGYYVANAPSMVPKVTKAFKTAQRERGCCCSCFRTQNQ